MKRGVAEGDMEMIIRADNALENILRVVLAFDRYIEPVSLADLPCRFDRDGIDIDACKAPTIFMPTRQRIHKARTCPDVERLDIGPVRDLLAVTFRKQICQVVDVIDAPRDRGAEVRGWNIPEINPVVGHQESAIEHTDRVHVLKVDRHLTARVSCRECRQFGRFHDQAFKVIPLTVLVARVQHGFDSHGKPSSVLMQAACLTRHHA